jgi:N-formylglutamate amidohydrolase
MVDQTGTSNLPPTEHPAFPAEPKAFIERLPPLVQSPMVFAAPHSGRHYPESFRSAANLNEHDLRLSEDAFVDQLFEPVTQRGATQIVATHARAYVDLNRAANELDSRMFAGSINDLTPENNSRVKAGLGVIPRIIGEGMPIYNGRLPAREAFSRLERVYIPYHKMLTSLLADRRKRFGAAVLIDCHSMPSGPEIKRGRKGQPDIILGDCWGSACAPELINLTERLFSAEGFGVRRNAPYAGGFATRHYGKPEHGIHALQIEINRSIYMDETRILKLDTFEDVQKRINKVAGSLINQLSLPGNSWVPKAAE